MESLEEKYMSYAIFKDTPLMIWIQDIIGWSVDSFWSLESWKMPTPIYKLFNSNTDYLWKAENGNGIAVHCLVIINVFRKSSSNKRRAGIGITTKNIS